MILVLGDVRVLVGLGVRAIASNFGERQNPGKSEFG